MSYSQKKKLFIFDLDGTVLAPGQEPYARLPDFFSEFLDSLSKDGWMWGINSTWDVNGQWQLVLVSSVKSRPSFLMGGLGYQLARIENSSIEFIQPYTQIIQKKAQDIIRKELYPIINSLCSRFNPSRMHFYGHLFEFDVDEREKEEFDRFMAGIEAERLSIRKSSGRLVAYPSVLNKGEPVREVMRVTGLSPEDIVVAGDEPADISMMVPDISKHPICPSNAFDEVKKHVKTVGGIIGTTPYAEGVIEAFTYLLKNKQLC